jgi:hypothetical protein
MSERLSADIRITGVRSILPGEADQIQSNLRPVGPHEVLIPIEIHLTDTADVDRVLWSGGND